MSIKTAVLPVAGMGTRFLPASKAQPKEMLSVVDKPVIQYIVEEAVESGIEQIIFVTAIGKRALENHFDRNFELEYRLKQRGKEDRLAKILELNDIAKFAFVRQPEPLGDGHAILTALPFVEKHEPIAVMFGDDIIDAKTPALKQLISVYEKYEDPVVALQEVPKEDVSSYGVIDGKNVGENAWEIETFVEKPPIEEAPSNLAAVGRYVITPDIFEILKTQEPGKDGEIRLADAFGTHLKNGRAMYGRVFDGDRYDCGSKFGYIKAQIELGVKHPEIGDEVKAYLKNR
jgi:UTP--glucose-1-phosphate uridylyltransferase